MHRTSNIEHGTPDTALAATKDNVCVSGSPPGAARFPLSPLRCNKAGATRGQREKGWGDMRNLCNVRVIACLLPNRKKNRALTMNDLPPPDSHYLNAAAGWCGLGNTPRNHAPTRT